jgi:hypothetical protein
VRRTFQGFLENRWGLTVHDTRGRALLAKTIVRDLNAASLTHPDKPGMICSEILFVDSRLASMIEFADLCAYAVLT